jgi:DNA repair protein RadC
MDYSRYIKDELKKQSITSPSIVVELMTDILIRFEESDYHKEKFFVVGLDTRNRVKFVDLCSLGSLTASVVHPRETFKIAIMGNAAGIIIIHNHPSGDPDPSSEDVNLTKKLFEAGKILGIDLLDHIIITTDKYNYQSMRDRGYI